MLALTVCDGEPANNYNLFLGKSPQKLYYKPTIFLAFYTALGYVRKRAGGIVL